MQKEQSKNRNFIALAAVGIHISIGSVYAWSVFTNPIMEQMGISLREVQWAFSLAIFFLGMSAAFLGQYVERYGPRKSGLVSAAFFSTGMFGAGLAVAFNNVALLYLFYSVIGGIGLGIGYITPVSTLIKWFPEKRGFATGLAIMGFGFGAWFASPIIQYLIEHVGVVNCFITLGALYLLLMLPSALYLAPPVKSGEAAVQETLFSEYEMTLKNAMHNKMFYILWLYLFINITCGISLLSVASPMLQEIVGMSAMSAAVVVGIIGIVNGAGRLAWSAISDYLGRGKTFFCFFVIQMFAFYLLTTTQDPIWFPVLLYIIISCYGGGFATMPAYLADVFGTKELAAIHGRILSAWACAGIAGPLLTSLIKESTGSYVSLLQIFSATFLLISIVALWVNTALSKPQVKK
ncbi:MAG TPA: OFA family MFS transporter [Candidatus Avacidaminococcus intestinavium]|uniref:OFA family MFS transporter n=1 Tax=Candidatus Avacidaminococcus intestinavium TaxID=2840684 RepID=A0A9D1SL82_9FIRM|nr:OFA family MFS transporter [Candidatus Avacidaminococcus intestinavium]